MSATIQDEFHPKQILKLTGQGFGKIQLFDDVNFPTLICVFKHFPNSPEDYNNNDATNYKLYIYDTITKRLVHTFENCSNILHKKYLFKSVEDNELYYDKTTKIMVRTEYNNNIYKIIKFEINYTNQFTLEKIYENSIDTTGYGEKCIVHLPSLSPTFILYGHPNSPVIPSSRKLLRVSKQRLPVTYVKHTKMAFFDSNDITIKDSINSYTPETDTLHNESILVFKQRYILLHNYGPRGEKLSWMLYDFVNMNCIKNWNFPISVRLTDSTHNMIVFNLSTFVGDPHTGIEIYNFARDTGDIPEDEACSVCLESIIERYAITPCGHTQICHSCLEQLTNCPICRGDKTSILKIY
jgi:hypothetical protein